MCLHVRDQCRCPLLRAVQVVMAENRNLERQVIGRGATRREKSVVKDADGNVLFDPAAASPTPLPNPMYLSDAQAFVL